MTDQTARERAVEPQRSVLVQAPAGSGKTSLLVERFIGLLAVVDSPEEILAITFTRKAAAEMRHRILSYLSSPPTHPKPHERTLVEKAQAIHQKVLQWGLLENPQRLQIRTIDGFCHRLSRTMPIASRLGPVPTPSDQPQRLYRQAARAALHDPWEDEALEADRQRLLAWCDHNHHRVETLIAQLLAKRDQWLKLIMQGAHLDRSVQDHFLGLLIEDVLQETHDALAKALETHHLKSSTLMASGHHAAQQLIEADVTSPITALLDLTDLPRPDLSDIEQWRGLSELMTTKSGGFRSRLTKNEGFVGKGEAKEHIKIILDALQAEPQLASLLRDVQALPDPHYSDTQWALLESLVTTLKMAAARLQLIFAQTGTSDFTALSAAALEGLGNEEDGYTDLALYLDRHIRHILVDEYQDTNWAQFHLLERLTQGWDSSDHRTLFLVGDPMQSIYRFREAEVGLFVRTRRMGICDHVLESVHLTQNFRSTRTIVDWVNSHLGPLFPMHEDIASGAIAYAASEATIDKPGNVDVRAFTTPQDEARAIADQLEVMLANRTDDEDFTAAIVVRARSHLRYIVPTLQQRGIPFRAHKLDKLTDRPVAQDLLALTQAVRNPEHWTPILALLRSPLVGLTLDELLSLTPSSDQPIDWSLLDALTPPAQRAVQRVLQTLEQTRQRWGRLPLEALVEGAWHRLGGPQCRPSGLHEQETMDAQFFFKALAQANANGLLDDWNDFIEWLDNSHTDSGPADDTVCIDLLTMHGAKGLEWDWVAIPSLEAQPNQTNHELLYWLPFTTEDEDQAVLIAPLDAEPSKDGSPLVKVIKTEQSRRQNHESLRLMYVAATRAKKTLWLSATIPSSTGTAPFRPRSGSLLHTLWPTLEAAFMGSYTQANPSVAPDSQTSKAVDTSFDDIDQTLYRPPPDWRPSWPESVSHHQSLAPKEHSSEIEFNWAGGNARRMGTVLHHLLERVGEIGIEQFSQADRSRLISKIPMLVKAMGTAHQSVDEMVQEITETFSQVLSSEIGQWILSGAHTQSQCEYALSGVIDDAWINAVIDRVFVDQEGMRWIIDYKSGHHAGGDLAGFLAEEADRYREQLSRYAQLMNQLEPRPTTTALYLPRHDALKVIEQLEEPT